MALLILVCSIFMTRIVGQSDKVRQYASAGSCADVPWYHTRPLSGDFDPDFDPIESPLQACSALDWFGTVPQSMFSLFCVMTLESWPDMARTLMHRSSGGDWYLVLFFVGFIFLTNIFLLNVVSGVIFESVLQISHEDEYARVRAER